MTDRFFLRPLPGIVAAAGLGFCAAVPASPLFDPDGGPLTGLFGWPRTTEGGVLTPAGTSRCALHVAVSSHSVSENRGREFLLLDGETTRIVLDWRHGLSERFEIGAMLPWVRHESGGLDTLIRGWHDLTGLPQGHRDDWPDDRLLFAYDDGTDHVLQLTDNGNGPGDLRLTAGWLIGRDRRSRTALRFGLKLPTGDSDEWRGSGSTDVYLGLAGDLAPFLDVEALSGFYRVTAVYLGTPDVLPSRIRHFGGQASAALAWQVTPGLALGVQTTLRSAPFDVVVAPLGDWALSLTAGARFGRPDRWQITLGVTEDIRVASVPDVTFLLTIEPPGR